VTLVTAIITIAATLIIPALQGMYGHYKKNGAADAVKAAWAQARSRAVEEGRPYRFTALPGTSHFRLAPDQNASGSAAVVEGSLPEGVTFAGAGAADGSGTSIIFLPDGKASEDAVVVFQVPGAGATALRLRALTGAVTVRAADTPGSR
jgi:Tfp pilus assembly protein FimT